MSKMKKVLLMCTAYVLVAALAIGGTIAYLTDTDSDVNVMTVGNVSIRQNEQQRVEKDGEFTNELEDFEQGKILMPVTYPGDRTADTVKIGDYELEFSDKEANYVDKIVSVTNTGKSDAYVRTLVAVPTGGADWEPTPVSANNCWLHWNTLKGYDDHWSLTGTPNFIEIDGKGYYVWEFIHTAALQSGKTTFPVIKGFYMDQKVDHDDNGFYMTYADGTTKRIEDVAIGDSLNVLVLTQAVQAAGFDDAMTALDTGFGDVTDAKAAEWFSGIAAPGVVAAADQAFAAFNALDQSGESGTVILNADFNTADAEQHWSENREYALRAEGTDVTFNLNGYTVNHNTAFQNGNDNGFTYLFTTAHNGKLTVNGDGGSIYSENADGHTCIFYAQGPSEIVINGGEYHAVSGIPVWAGSNATVTINGGSFTSSGSNDQELIYSSGGVIYIKGGFFHNTEQDNRPVNVANRNRGTGYIYISGGTFVNFDPSTGGDDPDNILIMDGYKVVSETQTNGDVWYTVVAE